MTFLFLKNVKKKTFEKDLKKKKGIITVLFFFIKNVYFWETEGAFEKSFLKENGHYNESFGLIL